MSLPTPDPAFRWTVEPWGNALRCAPLGAVAQHVFTSRQLQLPTPEGWAAAAVSVGGIPENLRRVKQVHGNSVRVLTRGETRDDDAEARPDGDAVVSNVPGLVLAVLVADCVPVLLSGTGGVVAAVHAGRPGLVAGVVPRTLDVMRDLGAGEVDAVVGPSVCGRCYEVPEGMRDVAAAVQPVSATVSWTGTPAIDVAAGVVAQLRDAGVEVRWVPGCSRERDDLYSYRRDGRTGRFAGVVARSEA